LQVTLTKTQKHSCYKLLTAMGTSAQATKDKTLAIPKAMCFHTRKLF